MASLILPRGVLIALVYPIHGDRQGGPPFSVSPEIYEQLLSPNFELLHSAAPSNPPEHRKGIEMIQVWQRR